MIYYAGTLTNDGFINTYRPVYMKYDEAGSMIAESLQEQLNTNEQILPINFPDLYDVYALKVIDDRLFDENDVEVFLGTLIGEEIPQYRLIKDATYYTKFEWLTFVHTKLFHVQGKKVWNNPELYYIDVDDEFVKVSSEEALGSVFHIVPLHPQTPVKIEGADNIKELWKIWFELALIEKPLHQLIQDYSNEQTEELEEEIDRLIEEVRIHL